MRKWWLTLLLVYAGISCFAQGQTAVVDSMKAKLAASTTDEGRFQVLKMLARIMMTVDPAESDRYGQQLIEIAETSRDKSKMIEAMIVNGDRFSYLAGRKDNITKSIDYYNKALDIARRNKIDTSIIRSYLALSTVHRYLPDFDKALNYCNQANSYSVLVKNDSINAAVHLEYGSVYMGKNEKLLALRNFLSVVRIGDELKNVHLRRAGYNRLAGFYAAIGDNDKAIDMKVKAYQLIDQIQSGQTPYTRIQELNEIGDYYSYDKNYDMASVYYERALKIADSVHYEPIKAMSYRSIIFNYLNANQPQKALDYFNTHPTLKEFLQKVNFGHFIDQSYGVIYMRLGKYDSARYYYNRVASFFENDVNVSNKYNYYYQLGMLHHKTGEQDKALSYFLKAQEIATQIGSLDQMSDVAERLDSIYVQKGDYKQAMLYSGLHARYKDSLNQLGREKDLLQIEAADEQQRMERLVKEEQEHRRRKNNIQYISIIIGIVFLFVALVILGMFKVSAGVIKALGFFVFLMLFEFVFLVFKKNIYSITHGEPLKDLAFMIALAALLVPLHHWLEHKVLHYLTSHNRLTAAGHHFKTKFLRRPTRAEG